MILIVRPCPFCGHTLHSYICTQDSAQVVCDVCGATGPEELNRADAMKSYNTREYTEMTDEDLMLRMFC